MAILFSSTNRSFRSIPISLLIFFGLPLICSAGGSEYEPDPNLDMELSLLYDADKPSTVPYQAIIDRLLVETKAFEEGTNYITYNNISFAEKINSISVRHNRNITVVIDWQEKYIEDSTYVNLPNLRDSLSSYNWGLCQNAIDASLQFVNSVASNQDLDNDSYSRLIIDRAKLMLICSSGDGGLALSEGQTIYDAYLLGIQHFYKASYSDAIGYFRRVAEYDKNEIQDTNDWLHQTATYLLGRTLSLQALDNWSEYSSTNVVDIHLLNQSIEAFDNYLLSYPNGLYSQSAVGLKRRAYFYMGDLTSYKREFLETLTAELEVIVGAESITPKQLNALKNRLREYRRFVGDDSALLLKSWRSMLTETKTNTALHAKFRKELSLLLDLIEEYESDKLAPRNFEQLKQSPLFELALSIYARHWQKHKEHKFLIKAIATYGGVFTHSSDPDLLIAKSLNDLSGTQAVYDYPSFNNAFVKQRYMSNLCNLKDSERIVFKQEFALNSEKDQSYLAQALVDHYLKVGDLSKLNDLFLKYPDQMLGEYSKIRTAVTMTESKSQTGKGFMNIGYFLSQRNPPERPRISDQCDQSNSIDETQPTLNGYAYFLKAFNELDEGPTQAKTLHFLVRCSSYKLRCGNKTLSKIALGIGTNKDASFFKKQWFTKTSKDWFDLLHRQYPKSEWAIKTPYYYN